MRKLNFTIDPSSSCQLARRGQRRIPSPLPYFIPTPVTPATPSSSSSASSPPSSSSSPSSAAAAAAAASAWDELICRLEQVDLKGGTTHYFNPYYYKADDTFELEPKEFVTLYFDNISDYKFALQNSSCSSSSSSRWAPYKSCFKKQHVFFMLQNSSSVNSLNIPKNTRLLDILIMHDIKSCVIPVTRPFSISEHDDDKALLNK
jgi:hypothetical protein